MNGPRPYRPGNPFADKAYRPGNPFAQPAPAPVRIARPAGEEHAANRPEPLTLGQGLRAGARAGLGLFTRMLTGVPAPTLADQLEHERGQPSGVDFHNRMLTSAVPFGDYGDAAGRYAQSLLRQAITGESDRGLTDLVTGKRGGFGGALDEVRADQARLPEGAGLAADLTGGLMGGAVLPGPAAGKGLLPYAKGIGYGAGLGAAYAAGEAPEGQGLGRSVEGGLLGAGGAAILPPVIGGVIRGAQRVGRMFAREAPAVARGATEAVEAAAPAVNRYQALRDRAQAVTRDLPPPTPEIAAEVEKALPDPFPDQTGAWQREAVESAPLPPSKPVTMATITPEAPPAAPAPANLRRGKPLEEQPINAILSALQRNMDVLQNDRVSPAQWASENNWGEMVSPSGGGLGGYIFQKASERTERYLAELARRGIDTDQAYAMLDDLAERGAIQATESGAPMRPRSGSPMSGDVPFNPLANNRGALGGSYEDILRRQREAEGLRAAIRDPETGEIFTGGSHRSVIASAPRGDGPEGNVWSRLSTEWDRDTPNVGFVDRQGRFVTRDEAERRFGGATMEDIRGNRRGLSGTSMMTGIVGSGVGGTAGASAGGAIGGRIGDTPEERERNRGRGQMLGGITGAILGGRGGLAAGEAMVGLGRSRAGFMTAPGAALPNAIPTRKAAGVLADRLESSGINPDDLERTLALRRAIGGPDRSTLADLSEGTRGLARDVSARPEAQGLKGIFRDRAQEAPTDVVGDLRRLANVPAVGDLKAYQAEIIQRAQAAIGPEFDRVFASAPVVRSPELAAVLARPTVKQALATFLRNEADAGRTVRPLFKGKTFLGADLRTVARLKESLDNYLFVGERGGDAAAGIPKLTPSTASWRAVNEARKALLDLADTQFGDAGTAYKALRGQYADEIGLKKAAGLGESILSSRVSPTVYGQRVQAMRPEEREAFRVGVVRAVEKNLNRFIKASTDPDRIQRQQEALGRLRAALGDDPLFQRIEQAFTRAKEQGLTNTTILNRSTTADALLGNQRITSILGAIRSPRQAAVQLLARYGQQRFDAAEARALAQSMGVTGAELDAVLAEVKKILAERQGIRGIAAGAGRAGAAAGGSAAGSRP